METTDVAVDGWIGVSNTFTTMVLQLKLLIHTMPETTNVLMMVVIKESQDSLMSQLMTVKLLLLLFKNNQSQLLLMLQTSNSILEVSSLPTSDN